MSESGVLLSNRYSIEIDGLSLAEFTEISGVSIEVPAVETKVSTGDGKVLLLSFPGTVKYGNITLKTGKIANASAFYDWLQAVVDGKYNDSLRNGTIVQLPSDVDKPQFNGDRWNFEEAWPSKWEIAPSGAGKNELTIETLTLIITRIWRD